MLAMVGVPRAPRFEIVCARTLFLVVAMLGVMTPSYASTITYDFATRIGAAVQFVQDPTLQRVQLGDVLHGMITIDSSLPDLNASPDVGAYVATSAPSLVSLTVGPYEPYPQETFSTSSFTVRIAENGSGFFGTDELLILNNGPFVANGDQVTQFEIRLDSDSPSFLGGTGFPTAVDLGLLNANSTFEFFGFGGGEAFEFFGSITEFEVATASVPEPPIWAMMLLGFAGLGGMAWRRLRKAKPA
jgi:hypothetical protein